MTFLEKALEIKKQQEEKERLIAVYEEALTTLGALPLEEENKTTVL